MIAILLSDILCSYWNVKVSDFGLSRSSDTAEATMTACGTPSWAAPEVIRNQKYSYKADVFSFGICLWEMSTRSKPYADIPPYQVVIAVAMKVHISLFEIHHPYSFLTQGLRPQLSPNINKSFMRLMVQCWDDRPEVRPPFLDITAVLESMQGPPPHTPTPIDPNDPITRSRLRKSTNSIDTNAAPTRGEETAGSVSPQSDSGSPVSPSNPSSLSPNPQSPLSRRSPTKRKTKSHTASNESSGEIGSPDLNSPVSNSASSGNARYFLDSFNPYFLSFQLSDHFFSSPPTDSHDSLRRSSSLKKGKSSKKIWGRFSAYGVTAPGAATSPSQSQESLQQLQNPPLSLPTISEATKEENDPAHTMESGQTGSSRNFMISL